MRDGHHAALEIKQQLLQPSDGIEVQVVGGFVQQQHIRPGDQGLGQGDPLAVTAGQRVHSRFGVQVQAVHGFFHALLPAPAILGFDLALQRIQVAAAVHIVIDPTQHRGQAALHRFKNGVFTDQNRFLRDKGNANALLNVQVPIICVFHAPQNFQKRRFACAVATN